MALDARGIVSAVEIGFYVPILLLAILLVTRHGISRKGGWIFLLTFSIIRIAGAAILVGAEASKTRSIGVYITAFVLESVGLSPLLMATLSFLGVVGEYAVIELPVTESRMWRLIRLVLLVALVLGIVAGVESSSSNQNTINTGNTLHEVSAIMFAIVFAVIVALHGFFWLCRERILLHRRTLLVACTLALPFLLVRVIFSVLSAYSRSTSNFGRPTTSQSSNSLAKFNVITGSWQIYLGMSIVMEYCVVLIYCLVGTLLPLSSEEREAYKGGIPAEQLPLQAAYGY